MRRMRVVRNDILDRFAVDASNGIEEMGQREIFRNEQLAHGYEPVVLSSDATHDATLLLFQLLQEKLIFLLLALLLARAQFAFPRRYRFFFFFFLLLLLDIVVVVFFFFFEFILMMMVVVVVVFEFKIIIVNCFFLQVCEPFFFTTFLLF